MTQTLNPLSHLKDDTLMTRFSMMVQQEREAIADLILHLSEIGKRRLYLKHAYSSLFAYLVEKHQYCRSAAYRRIQAAKLFQRCPEILSHLKTGELTLTTISLIEPHMTGEKKKGLIRECLGKSKHSVEDILTERYGKEIQVVEKIRRLPVQKVRVQSEEKQPVFIGPSGGSAKEINCTQDESEKTEDISDSKTGDMGNKKPESFVPKTEIKEIRRVKIEFVADERVAKKVERARELLKRKYPKGKLEEIFDEALTLLLEKKDPERIQKRSKKRTKQKDEKPKSLMKRYIPAEIRRSVWLRDGGVCQYQQPNGKRCDARGGVEIDHIKPFAIGGTHTLDNLRVLCRPHNQWRSELTFGSS